VKPNIKNVLSALVGAEYSAPRLSRLARQQMEAIWDDLSAREISKLDAWLNDQVMAAQGRPQIEWTYIRAAFTSMQQARGSAPPT
jgi:hypothetical protein